MTKAPTPPRRAHLHLRRRGHHGGSILPHRSIWSLRLPFHRLLVGVVIAAGFTLLLLAVEPWLAWAWGETLVGWLQALALPGHFLAVAADGTGPGGVASIVPIAVPRVDLQTPELGLVALGTHALVVVATWVLSGWLPDAARPACYLLRFASLIHGSAVVYFALWPGSFPHSPTGHVGAGLRQVWALMLLVPWLHLATYHLFPFRWWRRVLLTAVSLAWLAVLAPLLYALHAALIALLGPVVMPILHLLLGVMVPILGLVALYGWAMSWQAPGGRQPMPRVLPQTAPGPIEPPGLGA